MKLNSIKELIDIDTNYKLGGYETPKGCGVLDLIRKLKESKITISQLDVHIHLEYNDIKYSVVYTFTFKDNIFYTIEWSTIYEA